VSLERIQEGEKPPPEPPLTDQRPYSDLVRLAETDALPHTPLTVGAKCVLNVPDFCDHVLFASRSFAKEQAHYWLMELSQAQIAWNRYQYLLADGQYAEADAGGPP
jgi:hypothetical protein